MLSLVSLALVDCFSYTNYNILIECLVDMSQCVVVRLVRETYKGYVTLEPRVTTLLCQ